jgi:hypothetical protein
MPTKPFQLTSAPVALGLTRQQFFFAPPVDGQIIECLTGRNGDPAAILRFGFGKPPGFDQPIDQRLQILDLYHQTTAAIA